MDQLLWSAPLTNTLSPYQLDINHLTDINS